MKYLIITLSLLTTFTVNAEPKINIECKEVAKNEMASYKLYSKNGTVKLSSLETFCMSGSGAAYLGNSLEQGLKDAIGILPYHSSNAIDTAALLSSYANGYLYTSAQMLMSKESK